MVKESLPAGTQNAQLRGVLVPDVPVLGTVAMAISQKLAPVAGIVPLFLVPAELTVHR